MSNAAARPALEMFTSRPFVSWVRDARLSILLTTYQSGKVLFLSVNPDTGKLAIFEPRSIDP